MRFDIALQPTLREIGAGVPGSLTDCGIAKMAVRENRKGTLLPAGFTNARNFEVVSATRGTNRYPALVCLADYRGHVVRVVATSEDHLAYEIAYCNDVDQRENLTARLRASHHRREIVFHAQTRPVREGTANWPVTAPEAVAAPPADGRMRDVSALREEARNFARRKNVTLAEAQQNAAILLAGSTVDVTAGEAEKIAASTKTAWQRERERLNRGKRPTGRRRAPVRITGNRWL